VSKRARKQDLSEVRNKKFCDENPSSLARNEGWRGGEASGSGEQERKEKELPGASTHTGRTKRKLRGRFQTERTGRGKKSKAKRADASGKRLRRGKDRGTNSEGGIWWEGGKRESPPGVSAERLEAEG